jgi:hypothetical protein
MPACPVSAEISLQREEGRVFNILTASSSYIVSGVCVAVRGSYSKNLVTKGSNDELAYIWIHPLEKLIGLSCLVFCFQAYFNAMGFYRL